MKASVFALLAALLLALLPASVAAQPAPLVVARAEVVVGDLATVDRPILIEGTVEGDVTSWSGAITVEGEVRGDVVSYVGPIVLGPNATVTGSVMAMAGGVQGTEAKVAGQLLGDSPVAGGSLVAGLARIFDRAPTGVTNELPRPAVSGLLALTALLLCIALTAFWPRRTAGALQVLRLVPVRAVGIGLLTTFLAALLLPPLAGVVALSLVGLPLLVPLLLVAQLPFLFGIAVAGRALAESAGVRAQRPWQRAALGSAVLLLPVALVGASAPLTSALLFYLLAGPGLGAAVLSRGGAYALRVG
jgi:hypothetical protein